MKISDELPTMHSLELAMLQDEHKFLLDAIQGHIWYLKNPQTYKTANKAHAAFFGLLPSDMEDKSIYNFLGKDEADIIVKVNEQLFKHKQTVHSEEFITNHKGEVRLFEILKTPKFDDLGNIQYVVCTAKDVTELREAQESIARVKSEVEQTQLLRKRFLSNISHEIRTPLNGISGFAQLIREGELSGQKLNKFIEIIYNNSNQLLRVMDDIIDLARFESNQLSIGITHYSLNQLLIETESKLRANAVFAHQTKAIKLKFPTNVPTDLILRSDGYRIIQLLEILLIKSSQVIQKGSIDINYTAQEQLIAFGITVESKNFDDEQKNYLKRVFDHNTSQNEVSFDLSLTLCKNICDLLGGNITLDTSKESTFILTLHLPLEMRHAEIKAPSTASIPPRAKAPHQQKNILIAEDNPANFLLLKECLSPYNYNIIHAINGFETIEFCKRRNDIDLVLMDLKMPVFNGFEATKFIKSLRPNLPVIAQSAFSSPEDKEKALLAGCDDFLVKPLRIEQLLESVLRFA